ncbi:MAG: hypothetical protein PHO66_07120 [Eubacteriales bacterium]|nr:hypothetical protein [Eubacteriales bacterium]
MDYNEKLEELLAGCDMRSELDRRRTYIRCVQYAEEMVDAPHLNDFLRVAAERLGQQRLFREVTNDLIQSDGKEKIHIRFEEAEGIQIIGNPSGLLYLSRIFKNLSLRDDPGEYVYFYYGEAPLGEGSLPLAVYRENDAYFEDIDDDDDDYLDDDEVPSILAERSVDPAEVAGFFVIAQPPEEFGMQPMKVYPVEAWEDLPLNKELIAQEIGREIDRMVVFTFRKGDGQEARIALDMADPGVGFITRADMNLLNGKG